MWVCVKGLMMLKNNSLHKKSILTERKNVFLIIVLSCSVFWFSLLFYKSVGGYLWDIVFHQLLSEFLFNYSLDEMRFFSHEVPIQAAYYPLYHLISKFFSLFFTEKQTRFYGPAIILAATNAISVLLYYKILITVCPTNRKGTNILYFITSVGAIIFNTARSPLTEWRFYKGQCGANPLHNPTMIFSRPFAILVIYFLLLYLCEKNKKNNNFRIRVALGIFLLFSVLSKPSFAVVFIPALTIFIVVDSIIEKQYSQILEFAVVVSPSILVLFVQFFAFIKINTLVTAFHISFGSFYGFSAFEVLKVSIASFPVPIILFSAKVFKEDKGYRFIYLFLLVGWLQMFLLSNGASGDFSWGYDFSIQFVTVVAIGMAQKYDIKLWKRVAGIIIFSYQIICGIQYAYLLFYGHEILI